MENAQTYLAFLSHRNSPLDAKVAQTLHRMLEQYRIPKELQRDGSRSVGPVFRSQEQSGNDLPVEILTALDHSQFLVVICTPGTPKSQWMTQEIDYFICRHGRNRVLTVLVAGTPEESIPFGITHAFGEDGSVIAEYEPLCAYLVAPSEKQILKNLKSEFLRLMAAMLNCPYDALRQRQKRYRMQKLAMLMGILAAVAMIFMLMLANRNQKIISKTNEIAEKSQQILLKNEELAAANLQIEQQMLQSKLNENMALIRTGQQQLAAGKRLSAMETLLNVQPANADDHSSLLGAGALLADAMGIYENTTLRYLHTIRQDTGIWKMIMSDNGQSLVTLDKVYCLRCFDVESAALQWEHSLSEAGFSAAADPIMEIIEESGLLLYIDKQRLTTISLETGAQVHSISCQDIGVRSVPLSPDETIFFTYISPEAAEDQRYHVTLHQIDTFDPIRSFSLPWGQGWALESVALSFDNSMVAITAFCPGDNNKVLLVLDAATGEPHFQQTIPPDEEILICHFFSYVAWTPDGELIYSYGQEDTNGGNGFRRPYNVYTVKYAKNWEAGQVVQSTVDADEGYLELIGRYEPIYQINRIITHNIIDTLFFLNVYESQSPIGINLDTENGIQLSGYKYYAWFPLADNQIATVESDGTIGIRYQTDKPTEYEFGADISLVAGSGQQELICIVPSHAVNSIAVITPAVDDRRTVLEVPPEDSFPDLYWSSLDYVIFPSGKAFLVMDTVEYDPDISAFAIYDAHSLELLDAFCVEGINSYHFSGFSADETKLIIGNMVYDLSSHSLTEFENGTEIYGEYPSTVITPWYESQAVGQSQLTAKDSKGILYWWTDGIDLKSSPIPYDETEYTAKIPMDRISSKIGYSGLWIKPYFEENGASRTTAFHIFSIEDQQWHYLENPPTAGAPAFAVGNTNKVIALAGEDQVLYVYNFDSDTIIKQYPLTVSCASITDMRLLSQDRYLLIFTDTSVMHLIDMSNGKELGHYAAKYSHMPTTITAYVNDDTLYLVGIYKSFRIQLSTGTILAEDEITQGYLPLGNQLLQVVNYRELHAISLYTWEELAEMACRWVEILS